MTGIDRRQVLAAAGSALGAASAGVPSVVGASGDADRVAMPATGGGGGSGDDSDRPLEVTVFVTDDLYELGRRERDDGLHAGRVVKTYLEGAFKRTDRWDVEVTLGETRPDPPREDPTSGPRQELSGECVCDPDEDCEWSKLLFWFRDWYWDGWNREESRPTPRRCDHSHATAVDANFLVARGTGGGESTGNPGRTCVATVGDPLMNLDPEHQAFAHKEFPEDRGERRYNAVRASLHEVGHCLMNGNGIEDRDDDDDPWGGEHDMSEIAHDPDADDYAITPMGMYGDQNNELTNDHAKENSYPEDPPLSFLPGVPEAPDEPWSFAFFYSEASLEHFYRKEPYDYWRPDCGRRSTRTVREGRFRPRDGGEVYAYSPEFDSPCEITVSLDGDGQDFDLYVTLDGRTPSRTDYDFASRGRGSEETVVLESDPVEANELGILVYPYRGHGGYILTIEESSR